MSQPPSGAAVGDLKALFNLDGKVAVVTGGGQGIGATIATALAAHGAAVVICGRRRETLEQTAEAIRAASGTAHVLPADVCSDDEVSRAREWLVHEFGGIDVLVNNAGIDPHYGSIEKTSMQDWNEILAVNLTGVFRCCRELGGLMLSRGSGSIVNVSSIGGHIGLKRQVPYCASKGGVEQLTKALAHDWAERGVRVNAIAYGFIATQLTAGMLSHEYIAPRLLAHIPMGRFGRLDEVAGAAVFLASQASSYVTGHSLLVDGGWTAT
ncbi:MAG: glucose 1-dehydrogenase [Gammaproteobacteria bacterium]|nr:glucose 1-dehydrogenase [Gammaproteobacteria bacterium]